MTLTLSPQSEAKLTTAARQIGMEPEMLLEELIKTHLPQTEPGPQFSAKHIDAIALLQSWLADAPRDPDGIRKANSEAQEFMENLNRNRVETGERPLIP